MCEEGQPPYQLSVFSIGVGCFLGRVFLVGIMITFVQIKEACGAGEADVPPHQLCPKILAIWKNTSRYDISILFLISRCYLQICFLSLVTFGPWGQSRVLVQRQTSETFTLITFTSGKDPLLLCVVFNNMVNFWPEQNQFTFKHGLLGWNCF